MTSFVYRNNYKIEKKRFPFSVLIDKSDVDVLLNMYSIVSNKCDIAD